jgi:hypothetical protein
VNGRVCWQSVSRNSVESCVEELAKAEMTGEYASPCHVREGPCTV